MCHEKNWLERVVGPLPPIDEPVCVYFGQFEMVVSASQIQVGEADVVQNSRYLHERESALQIVMEFRKDVPTRILSDIPHIIIRHGPRRSCQSYQEWPRGLTYGTWTAPPSNLATRNLKSSGAYSLSSAMARSLCTLGDKASVCGHVKSFLGSWVRAPRSNPATSTT